MGPTILSFSTVICFLCRSSQAAVITVSPQSFDAPIYTRANFICEGTGDELHWLIQGVTLTLDVQQERDVTSTNPGGPGNLSSILTITALPINNGIGIGCQILSFQPSFQQALTAGTLTVNGVSSVKDITFNDASNSSLKITWSPPDYFSNDIPPGSSISYDVILTDDEGYTVLNTSTTDTFIEVDNITTCDTFDVRVTTILAQHTSKYNTEGNGSYFITESERQPLKPSISFQFDCPPSKCIHSLMNGNTEITDYCTVNESVIEYRLSPFQYYQLTAIVKNHRNKTKATYDTTISTFHTQDINISSLYTNGSVNVQCVFVSGSTADGCHVIFTDAANGRNESFNIKGSTNTMITLSTSGNYTVTVYDIINELFYGPVVLYPQQVHIDILKISATPTPSNLASKNTSTVSSTGIVTLPTVTPEPENTTIAESADDDSVVVIVSLVTSTVIPGVLLILIILTISTVTVKRKMKKIKVASLNAERATCRQPQAPTNHYQTVNEVTVQLTDNRANEEDSYHVNMSEFIAPALRNTSALDEVLLPGQQRPSLTSTTTQETTLEDSITSMTIQSNDTGATVPTKTNNRAEYADITINNDDTTAPVNPPTGAQPVMYSNITGDITKRGAVTAYSRAEFVPPPSYDDAITQGTRETSEVTSSQCLPVAPKLVIGVPLVQGMFKNIPQADIETEDDYNITVSFAVEDDPSRSVVQPSGISVISPTNVGNTRQSEPNSSETSTDSNEGQTKKFLPISDVKLHVTVMLRVHVSRAIERDFMSSCGITGISQSTNYCSGEMVMSRNRLVKESELSKDGICRQQLVCGKLCPAKALHEEVMYCQELLHDASQHVLGDNTLHLNYEVPVKSASVQKPAAIKLFCYVDVPYYL